MDERELLNIVQLFNRTFWASCENLLFLKQVRLSKIFELSLPVAVGLTTRGYEPIFQ